MLTEGTPLPADNDPPLEIIIAHHSFVRWATEGGDPFADATWDQAWKISAVDEAGWAEIRSGLRDEAHRWLEILQVPREVAQRR